MMVAIFYGMLSETLEQFTIINDNYVNCFNSLEKNEFIRSTP